MNYPIRLALLIIAATLALQSAQADVGVTDNCQEDIDSLQDDIDRNEDDYTRESIRKARNQLLQARTNRLNPG